ncbi:hypothetical protein P7C70_g3892, partial [Phenoliferia sp. Uapishka_3]
MSGPHNIPSVLPIIVLPANQILFPSLILTLQIARPDSIQLIKQLVRDSDATPGNKSLIIGIAPLRVPDVDGESGVVITSAEGWGAGHLLPPQSSIFSHGTAARIIRLERRPGSSPGYLATVEGLSRISLDSFTSTTPYHEANITVLPSAPLPTASHHLVPTLQEVALKLFKAVDSISPIQPLAKRRLKVLIEGISPATAPSLVDILASSFPTPLIEFKDKLAILAANESGERVGLGIEIFGRTGEGLSLKERIREKVDKSLSRRQKEFLLLQQLQAIRQELEEMAGKEGRPSPFTSSKGIKTIKGGGEEGEEEEEDDMAELERRIKEKRWTEESRKVVMKEMKRLKKSPPQGAEHGVIRNYVDWLLAIPWDDETPLELSRDFVGRARERLDEDHYGLEKIKKRLLEWLAVLRLQQEAWAASQPTPALLPPSPTLTDSPPSASTALVLHQSPP